MSQTIYVAQLPPTPTPLPAATEFAIDVPETDLWSYTSDTLQTWNQVDAAGVGIVEGGKVLIILVIVVLIAQIAKMKIKSWVKNDDD